VRKDDPVLPPHHTFRYIATTDPATRGNAWPLIISHVDEQGVLVVDMAVEWQGSSMTPLSPRRVLSEIRDIVRPYSVSILYTDQYSVDSLRDLAGPIGLHLIEQTSSARENLELYNAFGTRLSEGKVQLPNNRVLLDDLRRVQRKLNASVISPVSVHLPRTSDGRHCDFAPCLVLASRWAENPTQRKQRDFHGSIANHGISTEWALDIG
jgi:hypothetical protein